MRRTVVIGVLIVAAVAAVAFETNGGSPSFRVDAVFDTARGMVAGQNVDVAGSKVGTVTAVKLLHRAGGGYRALIELSLSRRYMPFRANASCRILPEGIISENYVDCNPGTGAAPLPRGPSGTPTVPLDHTAAPLSLQAVLDTFATPAPERLRVLIDELGVATAGRGQDLNAILQRANPALKQTGRVLAIVDHQRDEVAKAVTQTDQVLGQLAVRSDDVRGFVDRAAQVLETTAAHRTALEVSIRRLPPLLHSLRSALAPIRTAATAGIPLLEDLRASAPGLSTLTTTLPAFTNAAIPAVRAVGAAAATGRKTIEPATPVVKDLRTFATAARPVATLLDQLLISVRNSGGIEGLLKFVYSAATGTGLYDTTSHFPLILPRIFVACILENALPYTRDSPGCTHTYNSPGVGTAPAMEVPPPASASADTSAVAGKQAAARANAAQLKSFLDYLLK